jgi:hypothetical protein
VSALVNSIPVLAIDKASWIALLGKKGLQLSLNTAQKDFPASFKEEAASGKVEEWEKMLLNRRQKLGRQVNSPECVVE